MRQCFNGGSIAELNGEVYYLGGTHDTGILAEMTMFGGPCRNG